MPGSKSSKPIKLLFLAPYPEGEAASQRFRFEQYVPYLGEKGIKITQKSFYTPRIWKLLYKKGYFLQKIIGMISGYFRRILHTFLALRYNQILVHRELTPLGPPVFEFLLTRIFHKSVIYDFDDAIWIPNTTKANSLVTRLKWHKKISKICKWSNRVSCGNAFLKEYAKQYNSEVFIIPTTIDTENYHNKIKDQSSDKIVIGWTGSHSTLMYLDIFLPALIQLKQEIDFEFLVISDFKPDLYPVTYTHIKWNKESEIEDLLKINIGIMPLANDIWSEGKCGFKALQFMSLGIPALVSPIGVNRSIVEHGVVGYHCYNKQDWVDYIKKLIEDQQLRMAMGIAGRKKVINQYSTLTNLPAFLDLIE